LDPAGYRRAAAIARRACRGRALSPEDWEEVEQDAALEAWRSGSVTRIWWAATDSARRIQQTRRTRRPLVVPLTSDPGSDADLQAQVVGALMVRQWLAAMPEPERRAVAATVLDGQSQAEVAAAWAVRDSTVSRRRAAGLERLRTACGESCS
jgi:DNA-directed RNA polymerase specialized sigma24 family protein